MPMFRKRKQEIVEAIHWNGWFPSCDDMRRWLGYAFVEAKVGAFIRIANRNGRVVARPGEWIVKDDDGFYPMTAAAFEAEFVKIGK